MVTICVLERARVMKKITNRDREKLKVAVEESNKFSKLWTEYGKSKMYFSMIVGLSIIICIVIYFLVNS
ncbi:hypothetical protein A4S06_11690 [Erysipelotrichaceae bacterium MTC7]|nr:hypothetical protein A4S06_11690 [Erysipelotrichaceae bacterium MTC7]